MSLEERPRVGRDGADGHAPTATMDELKRTLHYLLIEELGPGPGRGPAASKRRASASSAKLRELLDEETHAAVRRGPPARSSTDVIDNILGYGPIEVFLNDPSITEVMVNNAETIYVERDGQDPRDRPAASSTRRTCCASSTRSSARSAGASTRASPMVDARLPDGSRVNAVIHPLAINGPMLTIRKFSRDPFTVDDLIRFGTLDAAARRVPRGVRARAG